jgi:hypothetical protein
VRRIAAKNMCHALLAVAASAHTLVTPKNGFVRLCGGSALMTSGQIRMTPCLELAHRSRSCGHGGLVHPLARGGD